MTRLEQDRAAALEASRVSQAKAKLENALLPCPFCGYTRAAMTKPTCDKTTPYDPSHRAFPTVRCGCGASVWGDDWDQSGQSAINAWNRRAPQATGETP